ncbi:MAG: peptidylprolyl isomerase [Xenococcaceae cyanobacterium MO_188.B32]|nr:peptidylprolyl isomerase [Xenococcaceae cyanobacterium MO_188.B32]
MKTVQNVSSEWGKNLLKTSLLIILLATFFVSGSLVWGNLEAMAAPRRSMLAQGDAITDPQAILRYALPIDNDTVRKIQEDLEDIGTQLRGKRWGKIQRDVKNANFLLTSRRDKLLATVPEERQSQAENIIEKLTSEVSELQELVKAQDKGEVAEKRLELLDRVGELEALMVQGFPFAIPEEYANLPQLLGRAKVEMETTKGNLTILVDGYSAPINGGNFVDLVQRGFYDGLDFIRAEDFYILQAGDPPGEDEGFIDPKTGEYRAIPLEVLVRGDEEPVYGDTLEELGRYLDQPVLPFNAYGAIALARPAGDPNGGSSQFFFFKFDTEMTPPGYNLMDGRYSVFGYVIEGKEVLEALNAEDKIISAKVVDGIENLVQPS